MVNWVQAQMPFLRFIVKMAGLRQQPVEIEPGTVMNFWVPKDRATVSEAIPEGRRRRKKHEKPAVVLVHGFAADGLVTWQFQIVLLARQYAVYVPDLLFFGGSTTTSGERSPAFQAQCITAALERLGVRRCTAVGFSYGGMVAFKMAEARPDLVQWLVVTGSVIAMTDSVSEATLQQLGVASSAELLLPETVKGLKALRSLATYKNLWFPDFIVKDYLKVMFSNRKEKAELLERLVIGNKEAKIPVFSQRVLLLWGENDNIFNFELAEKMKEQLGEKTTVQGIKKAGHLAHLERPFVYTRLLKEFLAAATAENQEQ